MLFHISTLCLSLEWHAGALVDGLIGIPFGAVADNYPLQEAYQLPDVPVPSCLYVFCCFFYYLLYSSFIWTIYTKSLWFDDHFLAFTLHSDLVLCTSLSFCNPGWREFCIFILSTCTLDLSPFEQWGIYLFITAINYSACCLLILKIAWFYSLLTLWGQRFIVL